MRNHYFHRLALIFAGVLWLSTTPLLAQSEATTGATLIQPNDRLTIDVYKNPDLTRPVTVQPDGLISIPLVQSIRAAGLTPAQLKVELEKRLKEYLEVPTVTVIVDAIQSYRIYVIGKVQKPGILSYEKPLTVLQALAMAGGFQDYAKKKEITIIRSAAFQSGAPPKDRSFNFNYEEVQKGTKSDQNIYLESGDVIDIR